MAFPNGQQKTRNALICMLLTCQILIPACNERNEAAREKLDLEAQEIDSRQMTEETDPEPRFYFVGGKFELRMKPGKALCEDLFDDVIPYTEGYAAVNIGALRDPNGPFPYDGLWGYVDKNGNYSIQIQYRYASPFSDGLACVTTIDGKQLFIDYEGKPKIEIPDNARRVGIFSESLVAVEYLTANQKVSTVYIDKEGKCQFEIAGEGEEFYEEMALFRCDTVDGERFGYINNSGRVAIPATYVYARRFSEGLAAVCLSNDPKRPWRSKWGFIDKHGKLVIEFAYCEADSFFNGAAFVRPAAGSFLDQTIRGIQWANSDGHFIDRNGRRIAPANRRKPIENIWRKRWDVAQEPFKVNQ